MSESLDPDLPGELSLSELSPGKLLSAARAQKKLSLRQVAEKLHLLPAQVQALENDNYSALNGDIFCRGYLKSYAAILGIDPKPLIDGYLEIRPSAEDKVYLAKNSATPIQLPKRGGSIPYWFLAAIIAVVAVLWVYGTDQTGKDTAPVSEVSVIVDQQKETATASLKFNIESGSPQLVNTQAGVGPAAAVATIEDSLQIQTAETAETAVSEGVETVVAVSQDPIDSSSAELASNFAVELASTAVQRAESLLDFEFHDDCWVEVKDSQDNVIYANLKRAKDSLQLSGVAPFQVILGYAPGVSLEYNGEVVPIQVNRKNNAALLFVGRL